MYYHDLLRAKNVAIPSSNGAEDEGSGAIDDDDGHDDHDGNDSSGGYTDKTYHRFATQQRVSKLKAQGNLPDKERDVNSVVVWMDTVMKYQNTVSASWQERGVGLMSVVDRSFAGLRISSPRVRGSSMIIAGMIEGSDAAQESKSYHKVMPFELSITACLSCL